MEWWNVGIMGFGKNTKVQPGRAIITDVTCQPSRAALSLLEIVILKLGELEDILVLKVKIWIEADFSRQRGDLREYINAVIVLSLFVRFMDDQE